MMKVSFLLVLSSSHFGMMASRVFAQYSMVSFVGNLDSEAAFKKDTVLRTSAQDETVPKAKKV